MNHCVQRMRPLLGTFVEIQATGSQSIERIHQALDAAFSEIERVGRLMSVQSSTSDLGRLNRSRAAISIHPWTARVIRLALNLAVRSAHRFNPTVGGLLVDSGRYPAPETPYVRRGTADDILLSGCRIERRRPVLLTLDGIAKGWAVDRALARLRSSGLTAALVNAGGDWRCFGPPRPILRDTPSGRVHLGLLERGACATSSAGLDPDCFPAELVIDVPDRQKGTWTVIAPQAWLADALTKVAANTPPQEAAHSVRVLGGHLISEPNAARGA